MVAWVALCVAVAAFGLAAFRGPVAALDADALASRVEDLRAVARRQQSRIDDLCGAVFDPEHLARLDREDAAHEAGGLGLGPYQPDWFGPNGN